jgi:hypothetical protein
MSEIECRPHCELCERMCDNFEFIAVRIPTIKLQYRHFICCTNCASMIYSAYMKDIRLNQVSGKRDEGYE